MLTIFGRIVALAALVTGTLSATVPSPVPSTESDWPFHGRDQAEDRYSPLEDINSDNVQSLGLAWELQLGSLRGLEATPIMVDGVLYFTSTWSRVWAVDARTGKELWTYDPQVPGEWAFNGCCDVVNRGVAVTHGKVISATLDGRLIALDAKTGKLDWEVDTLIDRKRPYTITGAPRIAGNKVIIGNGGAEFGVRGYITAYDIDSGKQAWRFFTVPGSPDGPFEQPELEMAARTWSRTGAWTTSGGGGTAWDSMAYDPDLNTLYVGTGNGSPWSHALRSNGEGDNLFLSSILAIDPDTGRMKWYYQTTPMDNFDFTATQHIILTDLVIDGKPRKVLMQAPKNGFFYVLDRVTGQLISADNYIPVNWASHVDLKTGRPVRNDTSFYDKTKGAFVVPWMGGGHNWQPMSYNPKTGLVYIPAQRVWWRYSATNAMQFDEMVKDFEKTAGADKVFPISGQLTAWDPVKKKPAWTVDQSTLMNGGTLSTGGNLVFQGTPAGTFSAYDALTGKVLKQIQTGTGIIAAPITYKLDGVQYVAVLAGFGGATIMMLDKDAAARTRANFGRLLVFKLGGGDAELPPELDEPFGNDPGATKIAPIPEGEVARGIDLYRTNCARCHGMLTSTSMLPDLRRMPKEFLDNYDLIVREGALAGTGMASFADKLSKADTDAIKTALIWLRDKDPAQFADPSLYPMRTKR